MENVMKILILGVFATAMIDMWVICSHKALKLPKTNWAMVGRWLGHMPKGTLVHRSIASSAAVKYERFMGWAFHYIIGVVYAYIYVVFVIWGLGASTLLSAWLFGLITILAGWLILQPSLGLGICASKAPQPNIMRLQNLAIHTVFGVALYYGWLWGHVDQ
ncbi:DUF2938 family protein [Amphritea sp. 1_MG-2023]|uniref:DUF2938 family protein n=1 Tax=Amphritea sp. 1_MG-2023 TaxID=3062670 RepID=UPI0026E116AB|nr:DUF2938 family protein [Amphritea sp. 1_MG-2023]MDO6561966.1 DUF2938 family protein [Amphritea sp. 1_MG-2023]